MLSDEGLQEPTHPDVRNAILDILLTRHDKPVPSRNTPANAPGPRDRSAGRGQCFSACFSACSISSCPSPVPRACGRDDHPADHHVAALCLRVEQTQVGHQLVIVPGHHVAGVAFQVLAVDVLVDAFLLDDEHLGAQLQNGVQLLLAQIAVVFADPIDCHLPVP